MNTKIIMSFAMAHNGWAFSHWLWERLRRHYGLYEVGAVYNDYLVAPDIVRGRDSSNFRRKIDDRSTTTTRPASEISEDDPRTEPSRPIGTMRDDWKALFLEALGSAAVALVVLTTEYDESGWCAEEVDLIVGERQTRMGGGRALRIVVLCLVPTESTALRARFPGADIVRAAKYGDFDKTRSDDHPELFEPLLWEKEDWKITDDAWSELVQAIGALA